MNELDKLREKIDSIDKQLLELFLTRMNICSGVADYKRKVGMPVLDSAREKQVLSNKLKLLKEPGCETEVYEFFNAVMAISRARQTRELKETKGKKLLEDIIESTSAPIESPKVCYYGVHGTYSEEATIKYFGDDTERFCAGTFEDVFLSLKNNKADYAVLPIENSSTGNISEVMQLLSQYEYYITGDVHIPIHHCLMGIKGASLSGIKTVYSHEQGLLQSEEFLKQLPGISREVCGSTAMSAKTVAESGDNSKAAIAGKQNAEIYGLDILAENINTNDVNTTRFAIIAKQPEITGDCNKISAAFVLPHESGSLHHLLAAFAAGGLNLLKLESRPIPQRRFEYMFFADYEGNLLDEHVKEITSSVIDGSVEFKFIGNYRSKV